jgi:glycosyltransferase involved in cell wall biosynthesis
MDRSKQIRELSQTIDTGDSPFSVAVSAVAPTEPEPALDLSVVIPVYNEAESLPRLHAELMAVLGDLGLRHEILAIDDGSQDDSLAVLRRLQESDPHLKIIRLRRNFGQTAAFAAGFDQAQGAVVITMDADGQNDPADIPRLLAKMEEGYDIVSGWRTERREPFVTRRLPSIIANRLISQATDVRLHDYGCSLKAYRFEVVKNVQLYGELHRFIPALASRFGVYVAEVPVNDRAREHGRSKYGLSRTIRVILDLLTVSFILSYGARPMQLFGLLGLLAGGVGLILNLYLASLKLVYGYRYRIGDRPLLMLAVLLVIIGVQFLMMGLLGEIVIRTYHEAQNKPIYYVRSVETRDASAYGTEMQSASPRKKGEQEAEHHEP